MSEVRPTGPPAAGAQLGAVARSGSCPLGPSFPLWFEVSVWLKDQGKVYRYTYPPVEQEPIHTHTHALLPASLRSGEQPPLASRCSSPIATETKQSPTRSAHCVPPPLNPLFGAKAHFSSEGGASFSYQLQGLFTYKGCNRADTFFFKLCVFNFNLAKSINYFLHGF